MTNTLINVIKRYRAWQLKREVIKSLMFTQGMTKKQATAFYEYLGQSSK